MLKTNRFATWIATGLLLFDAWVIYRGANFMCLVTDSDRYCHTWEDSPVHFTVLAILVVIIASVFFLLPFIPAVAGAFREAVEETARELADEQYAQKVLRHYRVPLDTSLVIFLAALAVVVILLLQRWGVV